MLASLCLRFLSGLRGCSSLADDGQSRASFVVDPTNQQDSLPDPGECTWGEEFELEQDLC